MKRSSFLGHMVGKRSVGAMKRVNTVCLLIPYTPRLYNYVTLVLQDKEGVLHTLSWTADWISAFTSQLYIL